MEASENSVGLLQEPAQHELGKVHLKESSSVSPSILVDSTETVVSSLKVLNSPSSTSIVDSTHNMDISAPPTTSSSPESSSAAVASFYSDFELDTPTPSPSFTTHLEGSPELSSINTSSPTPTVVVPTPPPTLSTTTLQALQTLPTPTSPTVLQTNSTTHSLMTTPTTPTFASATTPSSIDSFESSIPRFGARKVRTSQQGSNISRRINMLESGKNENNSDAHTIDTRSTKSSTSGLESPDPSDIPDSFFEELLREDEQRTMSRSMTAASIASTTSSTAAPSSSSSIPRPTITHKSSMPLRLPSSIKNSGMTPITTKNVNGRSKTEDDVPPSPAVFFKSGDAQEDLRRLEIELNRVKEIKVKAEADAKSQRAAVMAMKTELQLVRNVLKRRETELGDMKDMSGAYEGELKELRLKLVEAERKLTRGNADLEAKIRDMERHRDEGVSRIKTLDENIKKVREELEEEQRKNATYEFQLNELKGQLEELAPLREVEMDGSEPAKVKELSQQVTDLEDTRNVQAALIEKLETKISHAEAEALEFKGKAELEYEALSDGFKTLRNRRSEEIKVLVAQLEQHQLQEKIIEKLQADIEQLQGALSAVATSHSTENARLTRMNAELNEALAIKDQEVLQVRQNMTEFEGSHKDLVDSLQATLTTINEEADAARRSRDEAVKALESLREELEALRHSLPINSKHMSLSQWSAEQQQSQQEQLKAIRELEQKLDGQVEEAKGEQQRANVLEANSKRKSLHLSAVMEHHLQLSNSIAHKAFSPASSDVEKKFFDQDEFGSSAVPSTEPRAKDSDAGTVSVRTMLKFLSQLQGRPSQLSHVREGTEATIAGDMESDYESQLRVYLLNLNDTTLLEPWAREKQLESDIQELEQKVQTLIAQNTPVTEEDILKQQQVLESKEQELVKKETSLRQKEQSLEAREEELVNEEMELQKKIDALPLSPSITPFGSPSNNDLAPNMMAAAMAAKENEKDEEKKQQQADMVAQQAKLIKSLEDKIHELERRAPPSPSLEDGPLPSPSLPSTPRSSALVLTRIGSQTMRSGLIGGAPDTPPPTIALPPIPSSAEELMSPRISTSGFDEIRKKPTLPHTMSTESLTSKATIAAATEAAVAAAVAKAMEAQKELMAKLEKSDAELNKLRSKNKDLESELSSVAQSSRQEIDMQKLRQENAELAQVLEDIRQSLDQAQSAKSHLESQLQKEKTAKDEAIRMQDKLQTQLEVEMQKKKKFLCF
ncbi:MAG: hypothetical protein J3Q66DRAFT_344260 [Benniella sp.]|nr:MAG: hypothetical protein J3Q66DRAFT_344260 [Benniella sp.]